MRDKLIHRLLVLSFVAMSALSAIGGVLARPSRPQPVIDAAHILPDSVIEVWNSGLKRVQDSTGVQIVVVTVNNLSSMTVEDYAQELFHTWGIGDKATNKGVLILVKPKTGDSESGRGRIRIHTGYGMEGDLPDAMCQSFINELAIPSFKKNDYVTGIGRVLNMVVRVATGEYTYKDFKKYEAERREAIRAQALTQELKDNYNDGLYGGICIFWPFILGLWYFVIKRRSSDGLCNFDTTEPPSTVRVGDSDSDSDSSSYDSSDSGSDDYDYGGGDSGGGGASGSW